MGKKKSGSSINPDAPVSGAVLQVLNIAGLKTNSPVQVCRRKFAIFHYFFAIMAFSGLKSVMRGIQRLENKCRSDPEASANRFPAQPAVN